MLRRGEVVLAGALIVAAAVGYVALNLPSADAGASCAVATVSRDGEVMRTIDLSAVDEPFTFEVADERGCNVVAVEHGRIRVVEADCPDRICEHAGWIDAPGRPIACIPHGLAITVERPGEASALDAMTR